MADAADETLLARAIAGMLVDADLGVWRADGSAYRADEHGVFIDQPMPTTVTECTLIVPLLPVRETRTTILFRAQLTTRLRSETANLGPLRERAQRIASLFDYREYTPPILGISHSTEYARLFFEPDTDNRVMVAQSFQFRGHIPNPIPGTIP